MSELPRTTEGRSPFEAGAFTIQYLSPSSQGFEVQTRKSLLRHVPGTPFPGGPEIAKQRKGEPLANRITIVHPREGETIEDAQTRLLARRGPDGNLELRPEQVTIEENHLHLTPGFHPLVGLRDMSQNGNTLTLDIVPETFTIYRARAFSSPEESQESLHMANPGATACVLMTTEADGSHKIVLQHRSKNNYFYGDIPGASVAGYLDGHLSENQRGTIQPVDTQSILKNNLDEMDEELGLAPDDISHVRITGVATDNIRYHTEFLLFGISRLSTDQIAAKVEKRAQEKKPNDTFDFEGQFVVLDGTPEAIETFLTKARCPLPPTHAAAFVAAGYSLLLERDGLEAANAWRDRMQNEVAENYRQMNAMVVSYWAHHQQEAQEHPTNKPPHNIFGYDPAYPPSEQGLPTLEDELARTGLMKQEEQKRMTEKEMHYPQRAYLFDVDGVLTNLTAKRVEQEALFDELVKRLERGEPIGLNTGRSLEFIIEQVLTPLEARLKGIHLLQNLFAIGEKGAMWITYDENGVRTTYIDESISVPRVIKDEVRELMGQTPYSDTMFYDKTKQTMVSTELRPGKTVAEFQEIQKQVAVALQEILVRHGLQDKFRVDSTGIAIDIENVRAGKALGARRFVELLQKRGIDPKKYFGFGDSTSDYDMHEELQRLGINAQFVFVGEPEYLAGKLPKGVIFTKQPYDRGTLKFLQNEP